MYIIIIIKSVYFSAWCTVSDMPDYSIFHEEAFGIVNRSIQVRNIEVTGLACDLVLNFIYLKDDGGDGSFARIDMTNQLAAGKLMGWEYIPYEAGDFYADRWE